MSIVIHSEGVEGIELSILIDILGLLVATECDSLTTKQAEKYLLNPFRNDYLRELGIGEDILTILDESGFLDDSKMLGEASFQSSIKLLKRSALQAIELRRGYIEKLDLDFG